ncbi:MAG: hypothetical protein QME74_08450 [Candidatus Edwardsbacteria bacterium]|nr:hypothetical protein [Candidatus Edwardsbacteria bacterium]
MSAGENWFILRKPGTREKAIDSVEAYQLVQQFNAPASGIKLDAIRVVRQPFSYRQYAAGKRYFEGVGDMRAGRYDGAVRHFNEAARTDKDLACVSDVDYLCAVCHLNLGDTARADSSFERFRRYSEMVVPSSFFFRSQANRYTVGQLVARGREALALYPGHFSETIPGPVLKHPAFHGFIGVPVRKPKFTYLVGVVFAKDGIRPIGDVGLMFPFGLRPFAGVWCNSWDCGLKYQLFRRWDNRLGAMATVQYEQRKVDIGWQGRVMVPQYGLQLESGYFVHPRLALFAGGTYYYWNESHRFSRSNHLFWHDNDLYAGLGVYVWEYFAIVGKFGIAQRLELGFNVLGMEMLVNVR